MPTQAGFQWSCYHPSYIFWYTYMSFHFISFFSSSWLSNKINIPRLSINASRPFIVFDNVTVMSKLGSEPLDNVPVHSKSKTMRCRGVWKGKKDPWSGFFPCYVFHLPWNRRSQAMPPELRSWSVRWWSRWRKEEEAVFLQLVEHCTLLRPLPWSNSHSLHRRQRELGCCNPYSHYYCCNPILDSPRFSWMLFYLYYYL